jgi:hypothetical protein
MRRRDALSWTGWATMQLPGSCRSGGVNLIDGASQQRRQVDAV